MKKQVPSRKQEKVILSAENEIAMLAKGDNLRFEPVVKPLRKASLGPCHAPVGVLPPLGALWRPATRGHPFH